jgi:hypothetical protein
MKMIKSTSKTSIIGVTLISLLIPCVGSFCGFHEDLLLEFFGSIGLRHPGSSESSRVSCDPSWSALV